jgi:hypothetical protein
MEQSNYSDAGESFTRVIEHDDNAFVQRAEWFRAGCMLKLEKNDLARRYLAMIAGSENHYHQKDAAKMLKRMKR